MFFLFLLIFLIKSKFSLQGFFTIVELTQVRGTLTIPESKVNIIVSRDNDKYCPGDFVNVTNTLTNVGGANVTGDLLSRILDPANAEIYSDSWPNIDLPTGQSDTYNMSYEIQGTETSNSGYKAVGNFSYDSKIANNVSDTFQILPAGIGTFIIGPPPPAGISVTVSPGNFSDNNNLTLYLMDPCQDASVTINHTNLTNSLTGIEEPRITVAFHPDSLILKRKPIEERLKESIVNVSVRSDVGGGKYEGRIYGYADGKQKYTNLTVYVQGIVFNLNVTVLNKQVCAGEKVFAKVNISTNYPDYLDINMSYQIRNFTDAVFDESNETLSVNMSLLMDVNLTVPANAKEGFYRFTTLLGHNLSKVSSEDIFEVIPCVTTTVPSEEGGGGVAIPKPSLPSPILSYNITLNLSTSLLTGIIGNRTSFVASVNNNGTGTVKSIIISIEGIPMRWITSSPYMGEISPGEKMHYLLTINIPKDAEPRIYELKVKATDS